MPDPYPLRERDLAKIKIGVLYGWEGRGPLDQWPSRPPAEYADIEFRFGHIGAVDYVFVLNDARKATVVTTDPARVWGFIQEPPSELHTTLHAGRPYFARVFTSDETLPPPKYQPFWGALQWAVGMGYDDLAAEPFPTKSVDLSWVTSNLMLLGGHRKRMAFLEGLKAANLPLSLYGRGFTPIERKWDALSISRYTIAYENYLNGIYWSEKLTDCFLSFSTPIYFGARDIDRYFPKNSYLRFDPDDPDLISRIKDAVQSTFHEDNREALLEARELCLNRYNTMFYLARLAKEDFALHGRSAARRRMRLAPADPVPRAVRLFRDLRQKALEVLPPGVVDLVRRQKRKLFPLRPPQG